MNASRLNTDPEPAFDKLAQLAAHITEAPYAAISFTGPNEQWCKAEYGWTLGSRAINRLAPSA